MNRRRALASVSVIALAACSGGAISSANVQGVFNAIQFALPLLDVLAAGIAVAVPGAAPIVALVTPYLNSAGAVFQTLSATMTATQAQPLVGQIEGYLAAAVTAVQGVVSSTPSLAPLASKVAQAQAVLGLLTTFVNGVSTMPTSALVPLPYLHR